MARRRGNAGVEAAEDDRAARVKFLSRNPSFLAELRGVTRAFPESPSKDAAEAEVLASFTTRDRAGKTSLQTWLEIASEFLTKWEVMVHPSKLMPYVHGVGGVARRSQLEAIFHTPEAITVEHQEGNVALLRVDLGQPLDVLTALFEKTAREHRVPRPKGRRRLTALDFQLAAYDAVEQGRTFSAISGALGRPLSSVKSAFLTARRHIFGPAAPTKREVAYATVDPETHIASCPTCQRAETFEQMCAQARAYAAQDHGSQRELGGYDTVETKASRTLH